MSIEASGHVWKNSKQNGSKLLLLVAIADYTNAEGWAWPSIKSLCQRTRMGERYIQKMLREIEDDGEIEIKARANTSNIYRIKGVEEWGVNPSSPGGEPEATGGVNPDAPKPLVEPSLNQKASPFVLVVEEMKNGEKRKSDSLFENLLPDSWLQSMEVAEAWKGFVEMRRAIKKPMTDRAVKLLITKLGKIIGAAQWSRNTLESVCLILDQSTSHNWQDVYDLKEQPAKVVTQPKAHANLQPERYDVFVAGHPDKMIRERFSKWSDSEDPSLRGVRLAFNRWLKDGKYS